ncbi:PREDICTED: transmembrane protein 102-like [Nanorana parkeri]|uniref:transmembrane protein 102-like n=1 Tax=Nanorana parkeri TaxID=125878 RepID=UPI0008545F69|nr:PREDICTED: transmembrane protein 102-like [Nanorana parkeri]
MTSSARPLTDVDFCSGSRIEEINKLLEELERRESGTLHGREVLQSCVQAKDLIFSLVGQIRPLPSSNAFLLLSGGLCSGLLDVSPTDLGTSSPFISYSISYTLLVPILRLPSPDVLSQPCPCHYLVPRSLWEPPPPELTSDAEHLTPHSIAQWFLPSLLSAVSSLSHSFLPLILERAEQWGNCASILLSEPSGLLIRFDVVPVVEVQGWPSGAQHLDDWVNEDGIPPKVFHLLPWGAEGQWRVGFPGVELYMRRYIHPTLSRVLRASMAVLGPILQKHGGPGPYVLWITLIHACERLPQAFLCQGQNAALCFLGLLEELSLSFLRGSCPNPFLPGCDLLLGSTQGHYLARKVSEVRAQPVYFLREVVREAKEVVRGEKMEKEDVEEEKEERSSSCYPS